MGKQGILGLLFVMVDHLCGPSVCLIRKDQGQWTEEPLPLFLVYLPKLPAGLVFVAPELGKFLRP
jgi:hypothetical protein